MKFACLKSDSGPIFILGKSRDSDFYRWSDLQAHFRNDKLIQRIRSLGDFIDYSEHALPFFVQNSDVFNLIEPLKLPLPFTIPFEPRSFRDFYAFEEHVKNGRKSRDLEMIPDWYEFPVFYYSNHLNMKEPGASVEFPSASTEKDFEMEVACVVGRKMRNASVETAEASIFGYCLLNDFSSRDLQRQEMKLNMGPAKGKDFASSFGPVIYTSDEFKDRKKAKSFDARLEMKLNEQVICQSDFSKLHFSFSEMLVRASKDCDVYPREIIGSGTLGRGCLMEVNQENEGEKIWLKSGDVLSLSWDVDSYPLENRIK